MFSRLPSNPVYLVWFLFYSSQWLFQASPFSPHPQICHLPRGLTSDSKKTLHWSVLQHYPQLSTLNSLQKLANTDPYPGLPPFHKAEVLLWNQIWGQSCHLCCGPSSRSHPSEIQLNKVAGTCPRSWQITTIVSLCKWRDIEAQPLLSMAAFTPEADLSIYCSLYGSQSLKYFPSGPFQETFANPDLYHGSKPAPCKRGPPSKGLQWNETQAESVCLRVIILALGSLRFTLAASNIF